MKNKYQEALERLCKVKIYQKEASAYDYLGKEIYKEEINILQELVNKETPMKPLKLSEGDFCRNCKYEIPENVEKYCPNCGQRLDWSDTDE